MLGLYIYIRNTVYKNVKWYDNVVFGSLSVYVQSVIIDTNIPMQSTVSEKICTAQICIARICIGSSIKGARPKVILVSYFQLATLIKSRTYYLHTAKILYNCGTSSFSI